MHAVGHAADRVRYSVSYGQFSHHGLDGGHLILAAEGHQHRSGTNGSVKPLTKSLLGADVQAAQHIPQLFAQGAAAEGNLLHAVLFHHHTGVLLRTVGIQKCPGKVHNGGALPGHPQARLLRYHGNHRGFQIFLFRSGKESVHILRGQHHRHPLLGLGNGQLRAVQTVVLLGHLVQVDEQPVRQFANGHRHAACTKVIAPLNQPGYAAVTEEPLELPLRGGIALLHLGTAGFNGFQLVGLGGAGSTAAAVPASTSAQQHNLVPGHGGFPAHVLFRGCAYHGTDFQPLGRIARVIHFIHQPGSKADLIAVGGIACRRRGHQLPLGQLAGHGVRHGYQRIRCTGDPHGLIHIGAAAEGIPNGTANAGGSTAERLDFRGMVVGLVLEHEEPGFFLPVHVHRDFDGAGVDLLAQVNVGGLSRLLQVLAPHGGNVHQVHGLLPIPVDFLPGSKIPTESLLHCRLADVRFINGGQEGGVPAVIRPVGVDHADLRQGGITVLTGKVIPAESQIIIVHGQAVLADEGIHGLGIHGGKARQGFHVIRGGIVLL